MFAQNKLWPLMIILFLLLNMVFPVLAAQEQDTPSLALLSDPIPVYTAADLNNVRNNLAGHYIQMANIDLSGSPWSDGAGWAPIGVAEAFTGTFDGNGFTINNLTINRPDDTHVGLFGVTYTSGQEQLVNIGLHNASVTGYQSVGALVGTASGPIDNCVVSGTIIGDSYVGGLVGKGQGSISSSHATAHVRGKERTGGLAGSLEYSTNTISDCSSEGSVLTEQHGGGLVGHSRGSIVSCHSDADVSGLIYLGGLAGFTANSEGQVANCSATGSVDSGAANDTQSITGGLIGWSNTRVTNSYATGAVSGQNFVGGLIGEQSSQVVTRCYAEGNVNGRTYVGGLIGFIHTSHISDSQAHGTVTGLSHVGGLVGWQNPVSETSTIDRCTAYGAVSGQSVVGGLIGNNNGSVLNSRAYGDVSGYDKIGGLTGLAGGPVQNGRAWGHVFARTQGGGLVGSSTTQGVIKASHAFGDVSGYDNLGGLVGDASAPILCSSASGSVTAQEVDGLQQFHYVGGLVGITRQHCTIASSFAQGPVTGNWYVGGLVGLSYGDTWNSYALGAVTGHSNVGGLIGAAYASESIPKDIFRCYSAGLVTGHPSGSSIGGLIGYLSPEARLTDSYYDSTTSEQSDTGKGEPRPMEALESGVPSDTIYTDWSTDVWRFNPYDEYPWHRYNRPTRIPVERIAGSNRYQTAVQVSRIGWTDCKGGAKTVLLAVGTNFPDSLAGVTLAYQLNAPILLTTRDTLPVSTRAEIERLGATKVIILGGTGAVSAVVADQVATIPGVTVNRIAGSNRYDTARQIAMEDALDGYNGIYLASGLDFPDALSAAAYAAQFGRPIMLNGKTTLSPSVKTLLQAKPEIKLVVIVGGVGAIADSVITELHALGLDLTVQRISGANRYETSLKLANYLWDGGGREIYLATGDNFPDALAGGVLAAMSGSGVVLIRSSAQTLPASVSTFMDETFIKQGLILGGVSAISVGVESALHLKLKE